ncbi:hypothetical protein HMI56_002256 [Coelomomyces lativittatus]|nr:hypothetical protein HMI56_002256 [Coelomomyces lativittatus]
MIKVLFLKESVKTSLQSISPTTLESNTEEPSDHVYQSLDAAHQTIRHLERLVKETLEEKEQLERECVETLSLLSECRLLLEQKEEEEVLLKLQHEKDEALILELQEALQETLLFCEHLEELNPQKTLTSLEKKESE